MIRILFALVALALTPCVASAEQAIVSFTFDDAPDSVLTVGLPLLEKYEYPATVYISTRNTTRPDYMDWDAVADAVQKYHCEIGAHTHTHARLTKLTDAGIEEELRMSAEEFNKHGYSPVHFASPFGAYDDRVLAILKRHYQSHRAAWPIGMNTTKPDPYTIASYYLNKETTLEELDTLLEDLQVRGGWVVFQLHHIYPKGQVVTEPWGTDLLADLVELVHVKGFAVLTVGDALKELHQNTGGT